MGLSRRDLILKYIVDYYIKTALPVGSQTLIEEFLMSVQILKFFERGLGEIFFSK